MSRRTLILTILAAALVFAVAGGGWAIVDSRAGGSGTEPIALATPSASPTESPTGPAKPTQRSHWMVAMLHRRIPVYDKPRTDARIRGYLSQKTDDGQVERVCLVRRTYESRSRVWYNVYLGSKPNESRGWISEKGVTLFPVYTRIVIDTGARTLTVIEDGGEVVGSFRVCVGSAEWPTPTGHYFITEKIVISPASAAYGVFALAVSAYSPNSEAATLFAGSGGQIAIHGTSEVSSIGQAVSHGCVRMYNEDVLRLSKLVATGSPVTITR